jgi:hypothetical protein
MRTPIEPNNYVNYFHIDQGFILGRFGKIDVEPYVAVNATKDTKGYQWNNRAEGEVGLKLVRPFKQGMVAVGGAYASEYRFSAKGVRSQNRSGPIGFASTWFGWNQPTPHSAERKFFSSLPGSTWANIGNISPFEKGNVIGLGRIEQGVTLTKIGRVSLIPQGFLQVGVDSDKKPWNNRATYGGDFKLAIPWKSGTVDFQAGYECADQYRGVRTPGTPTSMCGPAFKVNLWTGWRIKGGQ